MSESCPIRQLNHCAFIIRTDVSGLGPIEYMLLHVNEHFGMWTPVEGSPFKSAQAANKAAGDRGFAYVCVLKDLEPTNRPERDEEEKSA